MNEQTLQSVREITARYRDAANGLEAALLSVQEAVGYLPLEAQRIIADGLSLPLGAVAAKVAADARLRTAPLAKHVIKVCMGTACYVRGRHHIVRRLESLLGISVGQTTENREYSLQTTGCLGACGLAPVLMIDEEVFERVSVDMLEGILARY